MNVHLTIENFGIFLRGTDVAAIDVNMGCPKAFSVHAGMGSALLTQTDKVKEVRSFQTVRQKTSSDSDTNVPESSSPSANFLQNSRPQ